jgi:cytochrome c553
MRVMTKPVSATGRNIRSNTRALMGSAFIGEVFMGQAFGVKAFGVKACSDARILAGIALGFTAMLAASVLLASSPALAQDAAAAPRKPEPAKAEKIATELCAACHGPDGNSIAPSNPKIAAQHPEYLRKQLMDFKDPEGDAPAARQSPIMTPLVADLSEEDMRNLAAYYSAKPAKPAAARQKDLVELGRDIYRGGIEAKGVPACSGCHGPTGSGIPAQYPGLGGQFAEYTEAQLIAFRSGARANNASMTAIASRLSDREIKAVADYAAGLR